MILKSTAAVLGLTVAAAAAKAGELIKGVDVTADFKVGTEREWRGFNTGKDIGLGPIPGGDSPGFDGGIEVTFLDGFYVNGRLASFGLGLIGFDIAQTEAAFSGGYRNSFSFEGTKIDYDVGATYRTYQGDAVDTILPIFGANIDWYELYGSLGTNFGGVDVKGTVRYSPEIFGLDAIGGGEYWRLEADATHTFRVSENFPVRVFGGIAFSTVELTSSTDVDYIDWRAGVGFPFAGNFEARFYYVDTENLPAIVDTLDVANSRVVAELAVAIN